MFCIEDYIIYNGGFDMEYLINLTWDSEADVWIAQSDDIPGLVLESGSFDALLERVRYTVPDLIELNKINQSHTTLTFVSKRQERIAL